MAEAPLLLVVGSNRGIGLSLVKEALKRGWSVIGTARRLDAATELARLNAQNPERVRLEMLDMNDPAQIDGFSEKLAGHAVDAALINAGVAGPEHRSASAATPDEIGALMFTNAIAPIRLARHVVPCIRKGGVLAFTSSAMGSVAANTGGHELYRASKAALNSLTRGLANELGGRGLAILTLHPGWVRTDMGGSSAPVSVEESARGLLNMIEQHRGKTGHQFIDYQGHDIPW